MKANDNNNCSTDDSIKDKFKGFSADGKVNEKIFRSLEDLWTYIGSRYPHFPYTVLPMCILVGALFFISEVSHKLKELNMMIGQNSLASFYYGTCEFKDSDNVYSIKNYITFIDFNIPTWDLTVFANSVLPILLITISPRKVVISCLLCISIIMFLVAFTQQFKQLKLFIVQTLMDVIKIVASITLIESVPKYHRISVMVLMQLSIAIGRILALLMARSVFELHPDFSCLFEFFGFLTIVLVYMTYYTFRDSLFNLLALSQTDKLQEELSRIFYKSGINLPADVVIDYLAFENFEPNDYPMAIMGRMMKSAKIIRELLICGCICGCCASINTYLESEIFNQNFTFFFEKSLINPSSFSFSSILIIPFSFVLPQKRILPVIILLPVLFLMITIVFAFPFSQNFNLCTFSYSVSPNLMHIFLITAIVSSSITCLIKIYITLHLIEYVPTLIRLPVLGLLNFIQFSFEGNLIDVFNQRRIGGSGALFLVSLISMLIFLINPRKKIDMNVYFSELTHGIGKQLPPAPEIETKKNK